MAFVSPGADLVFTIGRSDGDDGENIVFYDREGGSAGFYRPEGDGEVVRWRSYAFGEGALFLTAARFTHAARRDFIAYFPQTGRGRLYTMSREGRITRGDAVQLGTGWTHLVRGRFSPTETVGGDEIAAQDILLYNARTGTVRFFASDGRGNLAALGRSRTWEAGWTHLVPGFYGGRGSRTDVMAYRRTGQRGTARFFTTDLQGSLRPLGEAFDFPGATHIARGRFGFGPDAGTEATPRFLVYDTERGQLDAISVYRGDTSVLTSIGAFRRRWTHLVVGDYAGERRFSDFLFYDATNGETELWEWTEGGPEVRRPATPAPPPPPPPPPVAPSIQSICANSPIPAGYILVDDRWDPTSCGSPTAITYNVWVIQRYDTMAVGAIMNVCASAQTPAGWAEVDRSWSPTSCGHPSSQFNNVKRIRRVT